MTQFIGVFEVF